MEITRDTKIKDLLDRYPWLLEEAMKFSDKAKMIDSPLGRMLLKKATIADLCKKAGIPEDEAIAKINELVAAYEGAE